MDIIRVVVADDHDLFRRGLTEVLEEEDDIDVVGQASDGREASEQAGTHKPDVVMMDLNMPGQGGIEATAYITQKWPEVKVLVLTVSEEPADLFRALGVGALGYVLKTASPSQIIDALHQVYQGWVVVSPAMAPRFMADLGNAPSKSSQASEISTQLTAREQDVLKLVARGMSNAEIAGELIVSENTVKTHVKNVLGKLQMKNRAEAAAYASRLGFLG
ncbi:MAG: response regulator transcription factor [Chloroflexi bacterium]|nr:response regulator transcription factor [Chloroflexota bacterium]